MTTRTETRPRLLREAAVKFCAIETLTQRRRVSDEGFRIVSSVTGDVVTVPWEEAANYVRTAVIRRGRALSGITGRKERVGGCLSQV